MSRRQAPARLCVLRRDALLNSGGSWTGRRLRAAAARDGAFEFGAVLRRQVERHRKKMDRGAPRRVFFTAFKVADTAGAEASSLCQLLLRQLGQSTMLAKQIAERG